jgi:hypothetical protein
MLIQYISIAIEFLIAVMGLLIVLQRKKIYGIGIFITFGIYVFYDLVRLTDVQISNELMYGIFFIATASAFWVVSKLYYKKDEAKKRK